MFDLIPRFPPMGMYGNILFGMLTTVAILRFHLLDINVAVRKITAYLMLAAGIAVPYIGLILLFSQRLEGAAYVGVSMLVFLIFVVTLQPLWRKVQAVVDKLFYRERYRFLEELEQFSQESHDISDLQGLSSSLGNILGRALQTTNVYILTLNDSGDYDTIFTTDGGFEPILLNREHPVIGWAKENDGIISLRDFDVIPRLELITSREKARLAELKAELFVPLKTKKDELVGLFILCEKTSGQPFSGEDEKLIMTVADRISVELENARLYASEIEVRKQLEAQNEERIDFLHQVAHEMKTPLTSLIASSDLLIENLSSGDDINRRLVVNIQRSADSMDRRVSELLFSAGLDSPEIEIKIDTLELTEVIESVTGQSGFLFTEKEQSLNIEVTDNLPKVKADRGRLEQILTNILSNANKFSAPGSEISLRTRVDGNDVIIEVEDEAEKITREDEGRLFEPYFRSEDIGKRTTYPGLGLGLAITRRLLEMQNGRIWINHNSKKGNIFAFSLPVAE
jgi:signal transduction histidine kinase